MASKDLLKKVVVSGIQPSGFIHLGNYLGAVQNWVHLQDHPQHATSLQRYYCVVDYHAITQKFVGQDVVVPNEEQEEEHKKVPKLETTKVALSSQTDANRVESTEELTLKTAATLLACGIDPDKSTLFV